MDGASRYFGYLERYARHQPGDTGANASRTVTHNFLVAPMRLGALPNIPQRSRSAHPECGSEGFLCNRLQPSASQSKS
jgi:hypothetical protein